MEDSFSTVGDVQYPGGGGNNDTTVGYVQYPTFFMISPSLLKVSPTVPSTPMVLNTCYMGWLLYVKINFY